MIKILNTTFWLLLAYFGVKLALYAGILHIWEDGSIAIGKAYPYIWGMCLPLFACQ